MEHALQDSWYHLKILFSKCSTDKILTEYMQVRTPGAPVINPSFHLKLMFNKRLKFYSMVCTKIYAYIKSKVSRNGLKDCFYDSYPGNFHLIYVRGSLFFNY